MSYDTIKSGNARRARSWAGQGAAHYCAVPECGEMIPRRLLMCSAHWARVPLPLQRAVYATWRKGFSAAYLAARKAAIQSVEGGQS
jgi:hypothetical protein